MHGEKRVKDLLANSNVLEIISCGEALHQGARWVFQIHLIFGIKGTECSPFHLTQRFSSPETSDTFKLALVAHAPLNS